MSNICKVCKTEYEGGTCPYCDFENLVILGVSDQETLEQYVDSSRKKIVEGIKNISVKTYKYGWNSSNTDIELKDTNKLKVCDGADCFEKVYKCPEKFAQNPADSAEERTMHISYEIGGKEKTVPVSLKPIKSSDHWELGIKIDQNLRLEVHVGVEGSWAEKGGVMLELV